jgi:Ca2+-binding EF-hand superfamily protein
LYKSDFIKLYKMLYPHKENSGALLNLLFDAFDLDKSGLISFSEFLIAVSLSGQNDPEKKLRLAFSIYDHNNNGRLEKKEFEMLLDSVKGIMKSSSAGTYEQILQDWDSKKQDYLTQDEFVQFVMSEPALKEFYLGLIQTNDA